MSDERRPSLGPDQSLGDQENWADYDSEATGFMPLPGNLTDYPGHPDYPGTPDWSAPPAGVDPLAAPGHGYTPPDLHTPPEHGDPHGGVAGADTAGGGAIGYEQPAEGGGASPPVAGTDPAGPWADPAPPPAPTPAGADAATAEPPAEGTAHPVSGGPAAVLGQGAAAVRQGTDDTTTPVTRHRPLASGTDWNAVPSGGGSGQWTIPGRGEPGAPEPAQGTGGSGQRRPLADPDARRSPSPDGDVPAEGGAAEDPARGGGALAAHAGHQSAPWPEPVVDGERPVASAPSVAEASAPAASKAQVPDPGVATPGPTSTFGGTESDGPAAGTSDVEERPEPSEPVPEPPPEPRPEEAAPASVGAHPAEPPVGERAAEGATPGEAAGAEGAPEGAAPESAACEEAERDEAPDTPLVDSEHPLTSYVLRVNGVDRPVADSWIGESLLYVLRERLGLAGAKDGCAQGECGACSVQVDGRLVASCLVPAATTAGCDIRTVEGLAVDGEPSDVQRALIECGAVQCGFCIPGMVMTIHDLLEGNHEPTELETRAALSGNLCRCAGYRGVLAAVRQVIDERAEHAARLAEEAEVRQEGEAAPDGQVPARDEPPTDPTLAAPHIPRQAGPYGDPPVGYGEESPA